MLQVQQLLAAAPEALKALGLAYRAFVIAPGSSLDAEVASHAASGAAATYAAASAAVEAQQLLLQQLSKKYRLYISQPADHGSSDVPTTAPDGSNAFGTAVLGLSASVLLLLPHPGERGSHKSELAAEAALLRCLPLLLTAVRRSVPVHCVGQLGQQEQQEVLAAAAAAGWSDQVGDRRRHAADY
jgi:hypothetical protein